MWSINRVANTTSRVAKFPRHYPQTSTHRTLGFNSNWRNVFSLHVYTEMMANYAGRLMRMLRLSLAPRMRVKSSFNKSLIPAVLANFSHTSAVKGRDLVIGAACLSVYNWEENCVSDSHISDYVGDLTFVAQLLLETLTCKTCNNRLKIDQKLPNITYCTCSDSKALNSDVDGWKPFIERPNTLVWRKEHGTYKGLFAYKMYGRLDQVTAFDFLRVQLDTEFRKQWDSSATQLQIIDENYEAVSDLVYWEMQWPKPFANRDYVFQRRLTYDPASNVCIISSLSSSHPTQPVKKSKHRVTEYWSFIVVRPFTDFDKPGLEFVLTYFDNPGLSIPSSVTTWVAMTGLPNFVSKLQDAAAKVTDLTSPEPAILRCLRTKLDNTEKAFENRGSTVVTVTEEHESLSVELVPVDEEQGAGDEGFTVEVEEEASSLFVAGEAPHGSDVDGRTNQDTNSEPSHAPNESPVHDAKVDGADGPASKSGGDLPSEAQQTKVPLAVSQCSPGVVAACSDNAQFLSNSAYA